MDIQTFAAAMTEALDGTWTVEPGLPRSRDRYLIGPDDEELHVCFSDWEKTPRPRLAASLPATLATIRHRHGNPVPSHEITVSPAKTPKTVAAETARRLLPGYRVTLAETRELKQRLDSQGSTIDDLEDDARRRRAVKDRKLGAIECAGRNQGELVQCKYTGT